MMMNLLKLVSIFLMLTTSVSAQRMVNTVVWQAQTKSGGLFVGVAKNRYDARNTIKELKVDKAGTKYEFHFTDIQIVPVSISNKYRNAAESFKSDHPILKYKYISKIELIALEYVKDNDLHMAISFYKNASRVKNTDLVKTHLARLHTNYTKFMFNPESPETIVTLSSPSRL